MKKTTERIPEVSNMDLEAFRRMTRLYAQSSMVTVSGTEASIILGEQIQIQGEGKTFVPHTVVFMQRRHLEALRKAIDSELARDSAGAE